MSTTIFDICKEIPLLNEDGKYEVGRVNRGEEIASVADDLTPQRPNVGEGLHSFTPEQLCSLRVPVVSVNGVVRGYQRTFDRNHARRLALALREGRHVPEITVAVDGNGAMYAVDGQHRAAAAVIAGKPISAIVKRLSKAEQAQLFADQKKAKVVDRNTLILAGDGPYERYIQTAVSTDDHAWGRIVSASTTSKTRITPYAMLGLLTSYVGNAVGNRVSQLQIDRWDESEADRMAPLVSCFGDKQSNPQAFQAVSLRSIGHASMYVFKRNEALEDSDYERWVKHMPKFPWERYVWVRDSYRMTGELVQHWNKRLHESRRVIL